MFRLKINSRKIPPAVIAFIAGAFKKGQAVVLPTDTIYGLSGLADDSRAIKKIRRLKKRPRKKPLLILVSDPAMLKRFCFPAAKRGFKKDLGREKPADHDNFPLPRKAAEGTDRRFFRPGCPVA
jgi:tRNA A37 threonylcarbamoyladenosine synthetase subunit TsaC/SUA5/YrdC